MVWKKGQCGNPKGRPKGSRHKITIAVENLLDGQADALTQKAIALALGGDMVALRLCMDRISPPSKSRAVMIDLPSTETAEGVAEAQAVIVESVSKGELTIDEGANLASMLEARRRSIETEMLEERLAALEGQ